MAASDARQARRRRQAFPKRTLPDCVQCALRLCVSSHKVQGQTEGMAPKQPGIAAPVAIQRQVDAQPARPRSSQTEAPAAQRLLFAVLLSSLPRYQVRSQEECSRTSKQPSLNYDLLQACRRAGSTDSETVRAATPLPELCQQGLHIARKV